MAAAGVNMMNPGASPTSGRAAMNTPNPNVHLLLEVREWLASQGHSIDTEYQIIVKRAGQPVGMLTLLPSQAARFNDAPDEFIPSALQVRAMDELAKRPMLKKQLAGLLGSNKVYLRSTGGLGELIAHGLAEERADGKLQLTDLAREMYGHGRAATEG